MMEIDYMKGKLGEIIREIGLSSSQTFFEKTSAFLHTISENDSLIIDVFCSLSPVAEIRSAMQIFQSNHHLTFRHLNYNNLMARTMSDAIPVIAIIMLDDNWVSENEINTVASLLKEQYKIVWIINANNDESESIKLKSLLGYQIEFIQSSLSELQEKSFQELANHSLGQEKLKILKRIQSLNAFRPISKILEQFFVIENKIVLGRKLLGIQNQQITKKDEQSSNQMELMNNVRTTIQKFGNELDRVLKSKYEELNKPKVGEFSKLVQKMSDGFTEFERFEVAEKSEKEEIRLPHNFEKSFLNNIKENLLSTFQKDDGYCKASLDELMNRLNQMLNVKGVQALLIQSELPDFPSYKNSISPYVSFNREFKGELMKRGIMEYFVALRDYTGIIMVATGLLAPLTIIANISESGFLKHLSNGVKLGMAGITIFLIFYGIYDLRKRIPKKRVEEFEREKAKAKEFIFSEGKRILSESSRDWTSMISSWIRDVSGVISNTAEKNMKDALTNKQNQLTKDKLHLQKQQQNIDLQQRNLQSAERMKDAMISKWREWNVETEKALKN